MIQKMSLMWTKLLESEVICLDLCAKPRATPLRCWLGLCACLSHIFLAEEAPQLWSRDSRRLSDSTSMVTHNNFIKLFLYSLLLVSLSPGRRLC